MQLLRLFPPDFKRCEFGGKRQSSSPRTKQKLRGNLTKSGYYHCPQSGSTTMLRAKHRAGWELAICQTNHNQNWMPRNQALKNLRTLFEHMVPMVGSEQSVRKVRRPLIAIVHLGPVANALYPCSFFLAVPRTRPRRRSPPERRRRQGAGAERSSR